MRGAHIARATLAVLVASLILTHAGASRLEVWPWARTALLMLEAVALACLIAAGEIYVAGVAARRRDGLLWAGWALNLVLVSLVRLPERLGALEGRDLPEVVEGVATAWTALLVALPSLVAGLCVLADHRDSEPEPAESLSIFPPAPPPPVAGYPCRNACGAVFADSAGELGHLKGCPKRQRAQQPLFTPGEGA